MLGSRPSSCSSLKKEEICFDELVTSRSDYSVWLLCRPYLGLCWDLHLKWNILPVITKSRASSTLVAVHATTFHVVSRESSKPGQVVSMGIKLCLLTCTAKFNILFRIGDMNLNCFNTQESNYFIHLSDWPQHFQKKCIHISAVKRLIASKIHVYVYIIYVCVYCVYLYKHTHI